jgi:lysophospholipase L1-like esterase
MGCLSYAGRIWLAAVPLIVGCGGSSTAPARVDGQQAADMTTCSPPDLSGQQSSGSCVPGAACEPGIQCHTGSISCLNGQMTCSDTGVAADGTSCGSDSVCESGSCVTCQTDCVPSPIPKNSAVVVAGDSICRFDGVNAWVNLLAQASQFAGRVSTVTNTCVAGRTIANVTAAYAAEVKPLSPAITGKNPTYLFVAVGSNDLSDGANPAAAFSALQSYWSTAKRDGFTIVGFTVLPRGNSKSGLYTGNLIEQFNSLVRAAPVGSYDFLVDENLVLSDPYDAQFFNSLDSTHPTAAGHRFIAAYINEVFGGATAGRATFNGRRGIYSFGCDISNIPPTVNTGSYHTACGSKALTANTSGMNNSAFGAYSLGVNTTGSYNSAFGTQTLWQSITGDRNTAFGNDALFSAMTATDNTAIGDETLFNATGSANTAIGSKAMVRNTSGAGNTAVGSLALLANTTGSNNTAVGQNAGRFQADGSTALIPNRSIYIGNGASGKDNSDSNSTVIGSGAIGQGAGTTVIGANGVAQILLTIGAPSGTCVNGSLWIRTDGGAATTNLMWICGDAAWQLVK